MSKRVAGSSGTRRSTSRPHVVAGAAERLEWWRIWEACSELAAVTFTYERRWMAWAVWTRAEERDPKPNQCAVGPCMCFDEEQGFLEQLRGQRDTFQEHGIEPKAGFAPPERDGTCPAGREKDDETLRALFGWAPAGTNGPLNPPGTHAIRHLERCATGGCAKDRGKQRHRWYVAPELHRPSDGAPLTTVTIDWRWTDEQIVAAMKKLRTIIGTRPVARNGGAPFWNRYGSARAVELHDLRARGGSIRAWAAEEAQRRTADRESERILAQRLVKEVRAAVDAAGRLEFERVLGV